MSPWLLPSSLLPSTSLAVDACRIFWWTRHGVHFDNISLGSEGEYVGCCFANLPS
jgi:hypothetical protein